MQSSILQFVKKLLDIWYSLESFFKVGALEESKGNLKLISLDYLIGLFFRKPNKEEISHVKEDSANGFFVNFFEFFVTHWVHALNIDILDLIDEWGSESRRQDVFSAAKSKGKVIKLVKWQFLPVCILTPYLQIVDDCIKATEFGESVYKVDYLSKYNLLVFYY